MTNPPETKAPITQEPADVIKETMAPSLVCGAKSYRVGGSCIPAVPVYRWFLAANADYLFTTHAGPNCQGKPMTAPECDGESPSESGYVYERVAFWTLPESQKEVQGLLKISRLFDRVHGNHKYTMDQEEAANWVSPPDVVLEPKIFQIFPSAQQFTKPVYRWTKQANNTTVYFYTHAAGPACVGKTARAPECGGERVNEDKWTYEKVTGYLFPDG